jgi:two-component system sensor histidine kinase PhoQ
MVIEDDGRGIAPALRDDILQRGTRADTYQHGHGIGLAIVRDLVKSYQGTMLIASSEQLKGAKFTLNFPL